MLSEYISNAWRNAKKDRKRFVTILASVALSTFCILVLYALTTTSSKHIEFLSDSLFAQNQNNQLFYISSNKERKLDEFLSLLKEEEVISGGYNYQMYITDQPFEPWIEYGDDILMQTDPIFIDPEEAASQGFKQKLIMGDYLSAKNEIVLSQKLLSTFFNKEEVFQGEYLIASDELFKKTSNGDRSSLNPNEIIGKKVTVVHNYEVTLHDQDHQPSEIQFHNQKSIDLTVSGIFNPSEGIETKGDIWIPSILKKQFMGEVNTIDQAAVTLSNYEKRISFERLAEENDMTIEPAVHNEGVFERIKRYSIERLLYMAALIAAIAVSILQLFIVMFLLISSRKYELTLQQTLGASLGQVVGMFAVEIFLVSTAGGLIGLNATLLTLQSPLGKWIGIELFLPMDITFYVIALLVLGSCLIACTTALGVLRGPIVSKLARGVSG